MVGSSKDPSLKLLLFSPLRRGGRGLLPTLFFFYLIWGTPKQWSGTTSPCHTRPSGRTPKALTDSQSGVSVCAILLGPSGTGSHQVYTLRCLLGAAVLGWWVSNVPNSVHPHFRKVGCHLLSRLQSSPSYPLSPQFWFQFSPPLRLH